MSTCPFVHRLPIHFYTSFRLPFNEFVRIIHISIQTDIKSISGMFLLQKLCVVVAGFLHYFFLVSFSWMFLEGVQLYILLVKVFDARPLRLRWYYVSGYGEHDEPAFTYYSNESPRTVNCINWLEIRQCLPPWRGTIPIFAMTKWKNRLHPHTFDH